MGRNSKNRKRKISDTGVTDEQNIKMDIDSSIQTAEISASPFKKRKIESDKKLNKLPDLNINFNAAKVSKKSTQFIQSYEAESSVNTMSNSQNTEPFHSDFCFRFKCHGGGFNLKNEKFDQFPSYMIPDMRNEYELQTDESLYTDWWENKKNFGNFKTLEQSMSVKLKHNQKLLKTKQNQQLNEIAILKKKWDAQKEEYDQD